MGMSASQARLIALTARMNDIEYQGQQINQQRTTLSNQINALYNTLLDMSVPTPPSTSDYTKVQYTGTLNASSFTLTNVTPKSDGTYNLKLGFDQSGNIVSNTNKAASIISTPTSFKVKSASSNSDIKSLFYDKHTTTAVPSDDDKYNSLDNIPNKSGTKVTVTASKNDITDDVLKYATVYINDSETGHLTAVTSKDDISDSDTVYVVCDSTKLSSGGSLRSLIVSTDDGGTETYKYNAYKYDTEEWETAKTEFTDDDKSAIVAKHILIADTDSDGNSGVRYIKSSDITSSLNIDDLYVYDSNGTEMQNTESETPYSIQNSDGSTTPLYTLQEAKDNGTIATTYFDAAVESLKHSFPNVDNVADSFYVYVEDGEFKFIQTKDTTGISEDKTKFASVYKQSTGTYAETKEYENCEITFDNDGRINTIFLKMDDGNTYEVTMSAETVTDQDAYEDAFNQYEYDKYKYDKEQQEINVKTSIIQAEDKNLELKLTRLDNERNAVNTEIDAVKKVVEDNIEKSFKTFSG